VRARAAKLFRMRVDRHTGAPSPVCFTLRLDSASEADAVSVFVNTDNCD
jgi:hypothetical protein